jgi:2-iminobutanoate/2-iminopropanoate deaminase
MKKIVETDNAPAAIGPYSQAIQFSGLLFVSGQIAIDSKTGEFVEGGCSCFLKNMEDFVTFNGVYDRYFGANPPARETVEVARLPKDAMVEVSAICGVAR